MEKIEDLFRLSNSIVRLYLSFICDDIYTSDLRRRENIIKQIRALVIGEYNLLRLLPLSEIERYYSGNYELDEEYSSIVFDYSLLNRPMIFFAYDLEEYRSDRDFYYDYEEFVPGPIAKTNDEIISLINDWKFDLQKVEDFSNKFFVSRDGKNTERFIKEILLKNR